MDCGPLVVSGPAWREFSRNTNAHKKGAEAGEVAEPMFDGPPSALMYEGVLALLSEKGA